MESETRILSTAILEQPLADKAADNGIALDMAPFIKIKIIDTEAVDVSIKNAYNAEATVVFTSSNAVDTITAHKAEQPHWRIYCIGHITARKVNEAYPGSIAGMAENAAQLAEVIIKDDIKEVIFFCGDKRRDDLPELLKQAGIVVNEVVVYGTVHTPLQITQPYDGVLFYSPSGVESFFSVNSVADDTVLFAIGNTTAAEIKKYSGNKIIIADHPGKTALMEKAIVYYEEAKINKQ